MNVSHLAVSAALTAALLVSSIPGHITPDTFITPISEEEYVYKKTDPSQLVVSSAVYAQVVNDVGAYSAGETVEVLRGSGRKSYLICKEDGSKQRWVNASALAIPSDPQTNLMELTREQLERYVNERDFKSGTEYFAWVDIDRQKTYIFKGETGQWCLYDVFPCSTGVNAAPTTRGRFTISERGKWFYSPQYAQGGKNWVRFNGSYLFHSVPFDETQGEIVDETLGVRASHGCVRLPVEDSQWIFDNLKRGTLVWVN